MALKKGGFSLVEVVIALAITAYSLAVIFGLLTVGVTSFRQSKGVSVSSQIAQQVFSQAQTMPFNTLVSPSGGPAVTRSSAATANSVAYTNPTMESNASITSSPTLYYDEQGNQTTLTSTTNPAVYWVNVSVAYPSLVPQSTGATSQVYNVDLANVMVQVVFNPGGLTPATGSTGAALTQWSGKSTTGVPMTIYSFQCFVARNS
jgi:uncharacterized protein (TIGR02598 family)